MFRRPLVLALMLLLAACGESDGRVRWYGLTLEVPDGWTVAEKDTSKLSLATAPLEQAEDLEAAAFLTYEPHTLPRDWRELVTRIEGELERDERVTVDGLPATRLVFTHDGNGTPLREMVVMVPARQLVMLFQPIVARGSAQGPVTFDRYRDTFDRLVGSIDFGAPVDRGG